MRLHRMSFREFKSKYRVGEFQVSSGQSVPTESLEYREQEWDLDLRYLVAGGGRESVWGEPTGVWREILALGNGPR
jgi:hypothetical protein